MDLTDFLPNAIHNACQRVGNKRDELCCIHEHTCQTPHRGGAHVESSLLEAAGLREVGRQSAGEMGRGERIQNPCMGVSLNNAESF